MKLGIISPEFSFGILLLTTLLVITTATTPARADDHNGDLDAEDVAIQSPWRKMPSGARRVVPAPTDSAWITLGGFAHTTIEDQREVGGFVVVGLPFDRFARGSPHASSLPLERTAGSVDPPQPLPQQPFDLALSPRLARSCVAAAWQAAGLPADDARLDAIVSRAHWSAVLPEARLRAIRYDDARLSFDSTTATAATDTSRLRDSTGANIGLEARLTWRLDRLLYSDDEPSFERIRLEQHDARARIGARVLEALFHWQRAALDVRSLPPSQHGTRDEAETTLRVMEAEAALDVLTNGWFTTYRKREQQKGRSSSSSSTPSTPYAAPVPITTRPADL